MMAILLTCDLKPEVFPIGVGALDQVNLVLSPIGFDGFLAGNRARNFVMRFIPDQRFAAIFLREACEHAFAMLPDALNKV